LWVRWAMEQLVDLNNNVQVAKAAAERGGPTV
jgi:hypothetical protein